MRRRRFCQKCKKDNESTRRAGRFWINDSRCSACSAIVIIQYHATPQTIFVADAGDDHKPIAAFSGTPDGAQRALRMLAQTLPQ